MSTNADLFSASIEQLVEPWQPEPLSHENWPPDYRAVYAWRMRQLELINTPEMIAAAKAYYSTRPMEFIIHWIDTYNPRKIRDKWMPFVFFSKQAEFATFLHELRSKGENGLVEKCRDAGATWECCAYSVWSWLFIDNDSIGWGSRKEDLVDRLGNPDSIFEKMRLIIKRLPSFFLPVGFSPKDHATFMKLINPENGSVIMGEAGDNIGRGGRTSMYFKDESAHYPRPELVEAALGDNTNVQIDISSVNGLGNVFHRRREAGVEWEPGKPIADGYTRVFVIDWSDHPEKTQDWYDQRRARYEREGLLHVFAQEVDRNYSAAVQNTIIDATWIRAAIDAHIKIPGIAGDNWSAALDVADDGADRNALAKRQGNVIRAATEWGERDPGVSTRNVIAECRVHKGIRIQYDSIGIGATVKSEFNRLIDEAVITADEIKLVAWNAGGEVQEKYARIIASDDQSPLNKDFFHNVKAQAWWSLRTRFYKTWRAITQNVVYDPAELISIDSEIPLLRQIEKELAQPTRGLSSSLKMIVNKKPDGTKSPNIADSIVMVMFPMIEDYGVAAQGSWTTSD